MPHLEGWGEANEFQAFPRFSKRMPLDKTVPEPFSADYTEACEVLAISAKSAAALARCVLQGILIEQGYESKNLGQQIEPVLDENDPKKMLPGHIRETIDAVRHFANFAAHPITEATSLQVIEVESQEAKWCGEII